MTPTSEIQQALDNIQDSVWFYSRDVLHMQEKPPGRLTPIHKRRIREIAGRLAQLKRDLEKLENQ